MTLNPPQAVATDVIASDTVDKELDKASDLSDVISFHDDSPAPVEIVQEQDEVEEEAEKSAQEGAQEAAQEAAQEELPITPVIERDEASDTHNVSPPNPRKRKSQFRFPPRRSKIKTATRASSLHNVSNEYSDVETNELEADDEQMNGHVEKPSRNKVSPVHGVINMSQIDDKPSSKRRQSKDASGSPKSRFSRIRSSVNQFFTGSFWDPPKSEKRVRRPPSQWWSPHDKVSKKGNKSKKRPKKVVDVRSYADNPDQRKREP
jgi:hypothetical protein